MRYKSSSRSASFGGCLVETGWGQSLPQITQSGAASMQARAKGYAYTEVGVVKGTRAVAVPILGVSQEPLAAISVAAIADRITQSRLGSLVALMKEQAGLISRRVAGIERARRRSSDVQKRGS